MILKIFSISFSCSLLTNKTIRSFFSNRRKNDLVKIIASNNRLFKFIKWTPKFNNLGKIVKSCIKWEKKIS